MHTTKPLTSYIISTVDPPNTAALGTGEKAAVRGIIYYEGGKNAGLESRRQYWGGGKLRGGVWGGQLYDAWKGWHL